MRQIRKILRDKRGEGYIDVAVMVLCVMLVIALGVRDVYKRQDYLYPCPATR